MPTNISSYLIAAKYPKRNDATVEALVPTAMAGLATRPKATVVPTPRQVMGALPRFQEKKGKLLSEWGTEIPWLNLVLAAKQAVALVS
jgi:hypothetical protein